MQVSNTYPDQREEDSQLTPGSTQPTLLSRTFTVTCKRWLEPEKIDMIRYSCKKPLSWYGNHFRLMKITTFSFMLPCLLLFYSCKKLVEDKKRDLLLDIITNGQWRVENYLSGTVTITDEFAGYDFQFGENGTVTSYKGAEIVTGSWVGDIRNYSITASFPSAPDPLKKLNGTWKIKDSGMDFVKAELEIGRTINLLQLRRH